MKLIILTVFLLAVTVHSKCPKDCFCGMRHGKKTVLCENGGMTSIPILDIEKDVEVLIISAPNDNPNNLTLGRIFLEFRHLQKVQITHSYIPAIGDSSFWPGVSLKWLDLSYNNLTLLREKDFNGLKNLTSLNLSNNNLAASPSATFRLLTNLRTLSLARNKLTSLVPRLFYELNFLENLDLSGNPIRDINPDHTKDLWPLKVLNLSYCQLTTLHPQVYQRLSNLRVLDLRHNRFLSLVSNEFRYMPYLRRLHLDYNLLGYLEIHTFTGTMIQHLGLSHNRINGISSCAFCNSSIALLDLSYNYLKDLQSVILMDSGNTLTNLKLSYNPLTVEVVAGILQQLPNLRELSLSSINLSRLTSGMFYNNIKLEYLDLSNNLLYNMSTSSIDFLSNLTVLDLSFNKFKALNVSLLSTFDSINHVYLDGNPWSCTECDFTEMLQWINVSQVYKQTCERSKRCARCASPVQLADREVSTLEEEELGSCVIPFTEHRVGILVNPQLGLIIALSAMMVLLIIVIIIILYRRHEAVYYTHEEERNDDGDKASLTDANGTFIDDKKLAFITIEDNLDDRSLTKNIIG